MKTRILAVLVLLTISASGLQAQWVVTDPTNLAQGIINSVNEMVETSTTAENMINNYRETVKIYEQSRDYYDKLRKVNNYVKNARKVQQCILMVSDISDMYIESFNLMLSDENFSVQELSSIAYGYSKLMQHGADELADLQKVVNPTDMSLTDKDRLDVIDCVHSRLTRYRSLTAYYTRKNISVSMLRAQKLDNMERTLQLYGISEERVW